MADGLISQSMPTLASGAAPGPAPASSDPGPAAAPSPQTFEQQRFAQDRAVAENPLPRESAAPNPRSRGHSPARDMREAVAARAAEKEPVPGEAPPAETPPADGQPPAEGEPAPEKFKIGQYEVSEAELGEMMQRQAAEDLRKATAPPSPDAYKLSLPENLKLPGGQQFTFDEAGAKATFDAVKGWAHNKGLSQSDFSDLMGIYASHQAGVEAALAARSQAEVAKVGVNAPQRVDAIGKWLVGTVGEKDAAPIRATIVTDAHVRFYEKIMHQVTSQGGASFSTAHRVPPDTNNIPGYANMSFEQRRLAQDQLAQRRGR
jgi:hypothetical protein